MRLNVRTSLRRVLQVVMLLFTTSRPASATCLVQGKSVSLQGVDVPGLPFPIDLDRVPAAATVPERRGAVSRLYVRGALAFTGSRSGVWFRVAVLGDAGASMIHAIRQPSFVHARAIGDTVIGSLVMDGGDTTPGRPGEPDEFLRDFRLPCRALALGAGVPDTVSDAIEGDGSVWRPRKRGAPVVLRAEPRWTAPALVLDGPKVRASAGIEFGRVATHAAWTRVLRRGEAATLVGWMPTADLLRLPQATLEPGCCSTYESTLRTRHYEGPNPVIYTGDGEIPLGTPVYDGPGARLWAVVHGAGIFRIEQRAGESWARLLAIPGVIGAEAYVATSSVLFPPGKTPP